MNSTLRNSLAFVAGTIVGMVINSGMIKLGTGFLPVPEGVNPTDFESIKANVDLYSAKHFIMPFIAHAIGTLSGAYAASRIAISSHKTVALMVGGLFLIFGIFMAFGLPEFWIFSIFDILFAYLPTAFLGWKIAGSPGYQ